MNFFRMKFSKSVLLFCGIVAVVSCNRAKPVAFGKLSQLEGTWVMEGSEKPDSNYQMEKWTSVNDTLMSGKAYEMVNGDSSLSESIQLVIRDGAIYYIPSVINQNDGQPVPFKMISNENGKFIFENREHDFPSTIMYEIQSDSVLNASIAGKIKGTERSMEFYYKRHR